MKYTKTMEEVRSLSNEQLFAYAKELGYRMVKTVSTSIPFRNLEIFLKNTNSFLETENLDPKNVSVYNAVNDSLLLQAEKELSVDSPEDRREIENWYKGMLEWVERDRKEFERLKARYDW